MIEKALREQFHRATSEDRRLRILLLLRDSSAFTANDRLLGDGLGILGHAVTQDRLRTDLCWLVEQGLVRIDDLSDVGLWVARLTARGCDVVDGLAIVPGVSHQKPATES
jgi:hypothetical protein